MKNHEKLTVYYDGLCKVCHAEISHYRKQQGAEQIRFIDICSSQFDAAQEQLDPYLIHKVMHARRSDGTIVTQVQAFIEIWKILPHYQFLARLAENRILRGGLDLGYSGFAIIRPWLPRYKKSNCQDSPYCEVHHEHPTTRI